MSTRSWLAYEDEYGDVVGMYVHMDGYPECAGEWIKKALVVMGREALIEKFITSRVARRGWSALYSTDPTAEPSGNVGGYGGDGRPVAYSLRTDCTEEDTSLEGRFFRYVTSAEALWKCAPSDMWAEYAYIIRRDGSVMMLESLHGGDLFRVIGEVK